MKKFTVMILCVSIFFIGLGSLVDSVGARFKSDERAVEIMRLARQAIGGEENIKAVQGLTITGKASKSLEFDKVARVERGDWELNLQLPNKISKKMEIKTEDFRGTNENTQTFERKVDVVVVTKGDDGETETVQSVPSDKVVIVKKGEGDKVVWNEENTNGEVRKVVVGEKLRTNAQSFHKNELFRLMISLFLTPPNGTDAEYKFVGEQSVDGTNCEIVQVNSGSLSVKLFLNKLTHLPVMMSYTDAKPMIFTFVPKQEETNQVQKVTVNKAEVQMGEYQVKFSDYRTAGGLQLPFKWTQTIDGKADEAIEVSGYEMNPANIADKFKEQPQKIMIRTEKQKK